MSVRLLDRAEVAERLHVSEMTVRRLGRAGHLEEIRVGQRAIRITEASVDAHLARRRVTRSSEASDATVDPSPGAAVRLPPAARPEDG